MKFRLFLRKKEKERMCACSPESQLCPGLHQEQSGQQGKGDNSVSLLCFRETSHGVLHSALGPSAQERCGTTGASAEEATKAEAPVLCRLRELGFSLEKALGRPYGTFQFQKGQGEGWRGTL